MLNNDKNNGTISEKEGNQVLYIKKERDKKPFLYNVYFTEKGSAYKYDVINEEICEMNPKKIRNELVEIFEMKEG